MNLTHLLPVLTHNSRLWPPGATARFTQPGDGLKATIRMATGLEEVDLDGLMLYHVHSIIQRDPEVFGETANVFVPERWLEQDTTDKIPPGAWRAFERGPRNCIGQELALIEARVVMAMVVGQFDFTKVGIGASNIGNAMSNAELDAHGQYKVDQNMYMVSTLGSR